MKYPILQNYLTERKHFSNWRGVDKQTPQEHFRQHYKKRNTKPDIMVIAVEIAATSKALNS